MRRMLALALGLSLLLSGCGGGEEAPEPDAQPPALSAAPAGTGPRARA